MLTMQELMNHRELVVVSNRLPVDRVVDEDGTLSWRTSPGGLVTAVEPIVEQLGCVWVGWAGSPDEMLPPFELNNMRLTPVDLSTADFEQYYEGFSNGTLWPLYHDVIAQPQFHRTWWERYRAVNQRFADRVAAAAPKGAIVWVHDYQLQLVPAMLRKLRPDVTIAFFLHIPFPPARLFSQLPWRRHIIEGLLGADVIGFQRVTDAASFRASARRLTDATVKEHELTVPGDGKDAPRSVLIKDFPISIDVAAFADAAARPESQDRARQIREELGDPKTLILGVDRLDYTKGIHHRMKAYEELLNEGNIDPTQTVFVQVATPSREGVEAYQELRDVIELTVGRLTGEHGSLGHAPLVYLHRGFSREEMVALYRAADVMLVTPLRDGMNLVAKEYVACRIDECGVLVLSEFTGAADELSDALLVNPHDVDGLKAAILQGIHMSDEEQRRRMRSLRHTIAQNDVSHWAASFLGAVVERPEVASHAAWSAERNRDEPFVSVSIRERLQRLAMAPHLLVATDFDGTISHLVDRPQDARIIPDAQTALDTLAELDHTRVAVLTGRSLAGLAETTVRAERWIVSGSHGAELINIDEGARETLQSEDGHALIDGPPTAAERRLLDEIEAALRRTFGGETGVHVERKPLGVSLHTRAVKDRRHANKLLASAEKLLNEFEGDVRDGKEIREFSVRNSNKGKTLSRVRSALHAGPVLFIGDDVTDEDAFATLDSRDLGIKVGPGDTLADERVAGPEAAVAVLALLAELRKEALLHDEIE